MKNLEPYFVKHARTDFSFTLDPMLIYYVFLLYVYAVKGIEKAVVFFSC